MTQPSATAQPQPPVRYLVTLEARPTFLTDATAEEMQCMQGHIAYMHSLFAGGKMLWGGRYAEAPFAVIVLEAASVQDVERWVAEDPSVQAGILTPRIHPFLLVFDRSRNPAT